MSHTDNTENFDIPNRIIPSPRIRLYLYGLCSAAGLILTTFGILSDGQVQVILMAAGAILGTVPTSGLAALNVPTSK